MTATKGTKTAAASETKMVKVSAGVHRRLVAFREAVRRKGLDRLPRAVERPDAGESLCDYLNLALALAERAMEGR